MDAGFYGVESGLAYGFIIFKEHVDLAKQPWQNIFLQL
jgi:hypothetical protein